MSAKDVLKPDFVEVLRRRRRSLEQWIEEFSPTGEEYISQLKKQYSLTEEAEMQIRAAFSKKPQTKKVVQPSLVKTDNEPAPTEEVSDEAEETDQEETSPRKRGKRTKTNEEAE